MTMPEKAIYVLDDDEAIRDAMQAYFAAENINAQTFVSAEAFLGWGLWKNHGIAIVDIHMAGMTGLELLTELNKRGSKLSVIVMTAQGDVSKAVRALKAGAVDFIEKPIEPAHLIAVVKKIMSSDGERRRADEELEATKAMLEQLTAREYEVLDLIVAGDSNKTIANKLGISSRTVESHRAKVLEKLACENTPSLVNKVVRMRSRAG